MIGGVRRWRPISVWLLVLVAGGLLWGGWSGWAARCSRRALAEARREIQAGRPGHAAWRLETLLAWQPNSDEAAYLLGRCEKERGRTQAAATAWARVPSASPFALRAVRGRMELAIDQGRLADAEQLITAAMNDPRIDRSGLPLVLALVYCHQGRVDDAQRLIEASWDRLDRAGKGASERAIQHLALHIRLRLEPLPVEGFRAFLDRAAHLAPDDDRVWLAQANLAIGAGTYAEAARWLDACLRRRPADVPVWRARLSWAVATNRIAEARRAAGQIPAEMVAPAEVHQLAAWLAARRGDAAAERGALERLIAADPADSTALDRLAELVGKSDQPHRAAALRRQKAQVPRLQARYQELRQRNQPVRDAAEMARLAEQLGQWFEAKAFLTLAVDADPERADLRRDLDRLDPIRQTITGPGRTLAHLLAPKLAPTPPGSGLPSHQSLSSKLK